MTAPATIRFDPDAPLEALPEFAESEVAAGTRASSGRQFFEDKARGVSAGIWESEATLGRWAAWPTHEVVVMLEGEVVMVEEDRESIFRAGDSFVIPKGRRCIWNQIGRVKKFYVQFDDPSGQSEDSPQPVVRIDPNEELSPSDPLPAAMLLSDTPVQHAHQHFVDSTGQFSAGVWQTTGYERKLWNSPRHELMYLVEGSVSFGNDKGEIEIFGPGDTFFVPLGAATTWKSEGTLRKVYCIFQPRAAA